MEFSQSPVLIEFGFGLLLMATVPLTRFLPNRYRWFAWALILTLAGLAYIFSAPFSLVVFLVLSVGYFLSSRRVVQVFSVTCSFLHALGLKPWFLPVIAALAGLFLTMAPAHILELIEEAKTNDLEKLIDGRPDLNPALEIGGLTDMGQPIGLYVSGTDHEGNDIQWLREHNYDFQVLRLEGADNESNCHGHVFTGGRYWVLGREVPAILRDNGYIETAQPTPGDIVVYRDGEGVVTHTGIVRASGAGFPTLVESKWGQFGVYIHPADRTPYAGPIAYYHTDRPGGGHQILIKQAHAGK